MSQGAVAEQQIVAVEHQQPEPIHKFLDESRGFWCQTVVLLITAVAALWAVRSSRAIERRKAAAEVIFASRRDEELTKAIRHIAALHDEEKNMAAFARKEGVNSESSQHIRYALNHYEYVSVGISQGIYDEEIFKRSSFTTMTRLYSRTKPYIEEARKQHASPTTYQEFECLACRWIADPLKHRPVTTIPAKWSLWRRY